MPMWELQSPLTPADLPPTPGQQMQTLNITAQRYFTEYMIYVVRRMNK